MQHLDFHDITRIELTPAEHLDRGNGSSFWARTLRIVMGQDGEQRIGLFSEARAPLSVIDREDAMVIRVERDPKPIPDRRHDWNAWVDGDEERGTETGPTLAAALRCLADRLEMDDADREEMDRLASQDNRDEQ